MERVDYESTVVQELLDAHGRGELNISPWYQRRSVWTQAQKSYLINSVFAQMPIPTIYIRHAIDLEKERTIKEVVDGQQRIRSIVEFRSGDFSARHPDIGRRARYSDLAPAERQAFLMTKLSIGYLIGASDQDVIEVFGRLNAVSKTLNAEEKRAARYSGAFHQFCLKQAAGRLPIWRQLNIFSATDISRMTEVQFIAEIAMAIVDGLQDFSAAKVDHAYQQWDEDFSEELSATRRLDRVFTLIAGLDPTSIKDTIFSRSPVFYSLLLVLDRIEPAIPSSKLEGLLWDIDTRFNDPRPLADRTEQDIDFFTACTASTQRIRSRTIRDSYIESFLTA